MWCGHGGEGRGRTLFIVDVELCPSFQLSPLDDLGNMPRVTTLYIVVCPQSGLRRVGIGGGLIHSLSMGRGGGGGGGEEEEDLHDQKRLHIRVGCIINKG